MAPGLFTRKFSGPRLSFVFAALMAFSPLAAADELDGLFDESREVPFIRPIEWLEEVPPPEVVGSPETDKSEGEDPLDARFKALEHELSELKKSLEKPKASEPPAVVYPTVKVTGFFQADAGWFQQDAASVATLGDVQDDRGFRRARLAAVGNVTKDVSYQLEMDFAFNGRPSFMDVWLDVAKVPTFGNVRIGQWRQPFGLDELTSVKELTFLERPLMFALAPFRQIGVGFHDTSADQSVTWAASVFGTGTDPFGNSIGDRGYGGATRVTAILLEETSSDFLIHVGGGYSYIATPDNRIQYRNVPEYGGPLAVPGSVPFFVDTLPIIAENANLLNAELAGTWGPFHGQSELRYSLVNANGAGNLLFPSFYAQAGWILTGEHRPYNKASAALGRIKPKNPIGSNCGCGAWEVAMRYSWINLNEGVVTGGELSNVTFGLNWYLNDFTKLQFNYINADLVRAPVGDSDTNIYAVRAQLDF
ncbi:MAG: porin [Planctomycetaceae bacterium]